MNAGLPTTGIGGIFYILSVIIMVFVEIGKTIKGSSNISRWKFVLTQCGLVCGIMGMIFLTGIVLAAILPHEVRETLSGVSDSSKAVSPTIFLLPFIILSGVILSTQIFRVYLIIKK